MYKMRKNKTKKKQKKKEKKPTKSHEKRDFIDEKKRVFKCIELIFCEWMEKVKKKCGK
jgi:hypothetical protein